MSIWGHGILCRFPLKRPISRARYLSELKLCLSQVADVVRSMTSISDPLGNLLVTKYLFGNITSNRYFIIGKINSKIFFGPSYPTLKFANFDVSLRN